MKDKTLFKKSLENLNQERILSIISKNGLFSNASYIFLKDAVLKKRYYDIFLNIEKNLMLLERRTRKKRDVLKKIIFLFDSEKIDYCILKGEGFQRFYEKEGLKRFYSDIDILISWKNLDRVICLLDKNKIANKKKLEYSKKYTHHAQIYFEGGLVELHWLVEYPSSPFNFDTDYVLYLSEKEKREGIFISSLKPEVAICYLSVHLFFHNLKINASRYVCDAYYILKNSDIDWKLVERIAKKTRSEVETSSLLKILKNEFGIDVPQDAINNLDVNGRFFQKMNCKASFKDLITTSGNPWSIKNYIWELIQARNIYSAIIIIKRGLKL